MDTLRCSLAENNVIDTWLRNIIFLGDKLGNIFPDGIDAQGRRVAPCTSDLV